MQSGYFLRTRRAWLILIPRGGPSCACTRAGRSGRTCTVPEKSQTNDEKLADVPGAMTGQQTRTYSDGCAQRHFPVASR